MKLQIFITCLLTTISVFASDIGKIDRSNNILTYLEKSPSGLELEFDNQSVKDENYSVNGVSSALAINYSYELVETQNLNLNLGPSYQNLKNEEGQSYLDYIEVGYSKVFSLDKLNTPVLVSLYYQYPINNVIRLEEKQNGSIYLLLESESEISANFSVEMEAQITQFFTTSNEGGVVSKNLNIQINPIYGITDLLSLKLPVNTSFEFNNASSGDGYVNTTIAPTLGYSFYKSLELELYVETSPFNSYDGKGVATNFTKEAVYGATLTYEVF